jgi:hypothetical protein
MRNGKHLLSLLTLAVFFVIAVASIPAKTNTTMSVANGQVPPDFVGYKGVLLIVENSRPWNKVVEKHFTKNYKGQIQFVNSNEIDRLYPDKTNYRFVLNRSLHQHMKADGSYGTSENEFVLDRESGKQYSTISTGLYGALLESYSRALEKARVQQ